MGGSHQKEALINCDRPKEKQPHEYPPTIPYTKVDYFVGSVRSIGCY